jgi:transcriptional regulator with XRE-family HTH domain
MAFVIFIFKKSILLNLSRIYIVSCNHINSDFGVFIVLFAEKLREIRKEKCLSQNDLATRIGVHQSMITQYENGRSVPSLETLVVIAKTLDVSIDYLVGVSKDKANFNPEEGDLVRISSLVRPKVKGVPVSDTQWKMINNFLQMIVEQLEEEGKIPKS